eukprot:gene5050-34839_t
MSVTQPLLPHTPYPLAGIPDAIAAGYTPTGTNGGYEQAWQGVELAVLEPNSLANHDLAVSLDGRFIAVASFTSEVKIWEMRFARDGGFTGAGKAMDLKGHKSQVMCTAFSPDNRKAITASKDGTLRVWNIDVRYSFSEDPKTLLVIPMHLPNSKSYQRMAFGPTGIIATSCKGTIPMHLPNGKCYQRMAFGPTGIIAASYEGTVHLISSTTGELLETIDAHDGTIAHMAWCPKLAKVPGVIAPVAAFDPPQVTIPVAGNPEGLALAPSMVQASNALHTPMGDNGCLHKPRAIQAQIAQWQEWSELSVGVRCQRCVFHN